VPRFDDNHRSPAVRANEGRLGCFSGASASIDFSPQEQEQPAAVRAPAQDDHVAQHWRASHSGGYGESRWQHMQQKATDELVGRERHGFMPRLAFSAVIFPAKRDTALIQGNQA